MKAPSNFHFINIKYTKYDKKNYGKELPKQIRRIGKGNFSHTSFGETIQFPTSLIHIEPCCFLGCVSLTKITFPPFLKSISDDCFGNCYNLKEIDASSVFHFGNCFTNCTSLSSVTVSSNLTTVSPKWLSGCKSLQKITSYGLKSVTSLVSYHISTLFKAEGVKCHQIEYTSEDHQRYGNKIPYGVCSIGSYCFLNSPFHQIELPNGITKLGFCSFCCCMSLQTITIPSSIEIIEASCFRGCSSLIEIQIPPTIKHIGDSCFHGCSNLTTLNLPTLIKSFGMNCFNGCVLLDYYKMRIKGKNQDNQHIKNIH